MRAVLSFPCELCSASIEYKQTLYPLLKRLERAGCITARSAEHNGRLRRYYRITDAGRARIEEFLAEWPSVREIYAYVEGAHHDAR